MHTHYKLNLCILVVISGLVALCGSGVIDRTGALGQLDWLMCSMWSGEEEGDFEGVPADGKCFI